MVAIPEGIDPYDYDGDWTEFVGEKRKKELQEKVNEAPLWSLSTLTLDLINTGLEHRNMISEIQESLDHLPPEDRQDKWYWFKRGCWFYDIPCFLPFWECPDVETMRHDLEEDIQQAKQAVGEAEFMQELVEKRRKQAEQVQITGSVQNAGADGDTQ